jgi:hypothetical protein
MNGVTSRYIQRAGRIIYYILSPLLFTILTIGYTDQQNEGYLKLAYARLCNAAYWPR